MQLKIKFPEDPDVYYTIEANVIKVSFYSDSGEIKHERIDWFTRGFSNSTPGEGCVWDSEEKAIEYLRKLRHYIETEE